MASMSDYKYKAIEEITSYDTSSFSKTCVCCFYVYCCHEIPFLSYLLELNTNDEYSFPIINNDNKVYNNICEHFNISLNERISFKSHEIFNGQLYSFYEITSTRNTFKNNNFEKCLIYEILNIKKINKYCISDIVINFFLEKSYYCYLFNNQNEIFEIPIIAFNYVSKNTTNYVCYNEILLEPNDDFYKLELVYNNDINYDIYNVIRYALFIRDFISLTTIQQKQIYTNLNVYDSIIISKDKQIYFRNKSQILLLNK